MKGFDVDTDPGSPLSCVCLFFRCPQTRLENPRFSLQGEWEEDPRTPDRTLSYLFSFVTPEGRWERLTILYWKKKISVFISRRGAERDRYDYWGRPKTWRTQIRLSFSFIKTPPYLPLAQTSLYTLEMCQIVLTFTCMGFPPLSPYTTPDLRSFFRLSYFTQTL